MQENANQNQKQRPWYFNLNKAEDTAVVRILHSTTKTIEKVKAHKIELDGKKKKVRCLEENCPLCISGSKAEEKVYIHLWDYTDNKEKIWERTDKIIPQLEKLEEDWGELSSLVVRITRKGDNFPKYEVVPLPAKKYADVDKTLVDEELAKFYSLKRNKEEIETFLNTGKFPERKPFIPKEEYLKQKNAQQNQQQTQSYNTPKPIQTQPTQQSFDDPFANM